MLVISRRDTEIVRILIPPSDEPQMVILHAVQSSDGRTKLGFDAEPHIRIYRDELLRHYKIDLSDLDKAISILTASKANENKNSRTQTQ